MIVVLVHVGFCWLWVYEIWGEYRESKGLLGRILACVLFFWIDYFEQLMGMETWARSP